MTVRKRYLVAGLMGLLLLATGVGVFWGRQALLGSSSAAASPSLFYVVKFICVPEVGPLAEPGGAPCLYRERTKRR